MGFLSSYSNAVGGFYKNMFNPSDYLSKSDIGYYVPILNQGKIAQENLNYQQNALEYNKSLQQQMFNREDNSVFRRAQDLKNAGMSPVLAAGQGASAGSPIAINPPQRSSYPDIVTMAYNLMKMDADITQTNAQTELVNQQIENLPITMANLKANTSMQYANARKTNADARKAEVDAHNAEETGAGGGGIFSNIRDLFGMAERSVDSLENLKKSQIEKQQPKPRGQTPNKKKPAGNEGRETPYNSKAFY